MQYVQSQFQRHKRMWVLFACTQTRCSWHLGKWDFGLLSHWRTFDCSFELSFVKGWLTAWNFEEILRSMPLALTICHTWLLLTLFLNYFFYFQIPLKAKSRAAPCPPETDRVTFNLIIRGCHCQEFGMKKASVIRQDVFQISSLSQKQVRDLC